MRAGRLTLDPEQVPDLAAKIPGKKPPAVHRENTGSARLAILLGKFLCDLAHQRPIPRADGLPQSLLQDCGRGVFGPSPPCPPVAASPRLPAFPFVMCRHGPPELVIRCKHPVIPVPMLARRRDEIGEPSPETRTVRVRRRRRWPPGGWTSARAPDRPSWPPCVGGRWKPAVLPGEHVSGGLGVDESVAPALTGSRREGTRLRAQIPLSRVVAGAGPAA
jgi:hypothetical protein